MIEDWDRVRALFEELVELPDAEREARLAAADPELAHQVRDLLAADAQADTVHIEGDAPVELLDQGPTRIQEIGSYRILRVLGSGGMGTVFEATQQNPRRSVAVKVLRSFLVTESARRRFAYEAEILARLHHPHIAQIYEAGTWRDRDSGEEYPFFAMEFVTDARALDRYADGAGLDLTGRLELFLPVCQAVHHGHLQGVLHRDLKPANILVGTDGRPTVIDFGIARDEAQDDRGDQGMTLSGQVLGTLIYMSPEQLQGDSLDVRSDLYSLAATLYELLTGQPPHPRGEDSLTGFVGRVNQDRPVAPSRLAAPELGIRDELDWILLKALEAEPDQRYDSVADFAADLQRFLEHAPVQARPQTTGYLLRKFVRRHRVLVGTVVAAASLLLATTVVAVLGWVEADRASEQARLRRIEADRASEQARLRRIEADRASRAAQLEAQTQQAVTQYMIKLIERARTEAAGREVTLVQALEQSGPLVDELSAGRADVAIAMTVVTANCYLSLRRPEPALVLLESALDRFGASLGPGHPDLLQARHSLGVTLSNLGRGEEAIACLQDVLDRRIDQLGGEAEWVAETRQALGTCLNEMGDFEGADRQLRASGLIFEAALADALPGSSEETDLVRRLVMVRSALATNLNQSGRQEDAESVAEANWVLASDRLGADAAVAANAAQVLGIIYSDGGRDADAVDYLQRALAHNRRIYGEENPSNLTLLTSLGGALQRAGRTEEALVHLRAAWRARVALGDRSVDALVALYNLAVTLERNGDLEEAGGCFAELFQIREGVLPEDHWLCGQFRKGFGTLLRRMERYPEAEQESLAALELMEPQLGAEHMRVQLVLQELETLYRAWGRPDRAAVYAARRR